MTNRSLQLKIVTNPLPTLGTNQIPTLILRGECEIRPRDVTQQYLDNLQQVKFVEIKNAGHFIVSEQPERYKEVVKAFLLDRSIPASHSDSNQ